MSFLHSVRFWPKADLGFARADVRSWGQNGHGQAPRYFPLLT